MDSQNLFYFLIASVLLTLAPGPDILFVIAQSLSQGKWAGIATALGLCTGLIFHTTAAALGLSIILYNSAIGFQIVKYAGVAYLLYLAFKALREGKTELKNDDSLKLKKSKLYKRGILMNILNPKVSLFFLAFLPQFVNEKAGNMPGQMIFLGIIFIIQAIIIFSIISCIAGLLSKRLLVNPRMNKIIKWAKVGIFGFIAIKLALAKK